MSYYLGASIHAHTQRCASVARRQGCKIRGTGAIGASTECALARGIMLWAPRHRHSLAERFREGIGEGCFNCQVAVTLPLGPPPPLVQTGADAVLARGHSEQEPIREDPVTVGVSGKQGVPSRGLHRVQVGDLTFGLVVNSVSGGQRRRNLNCAPSAGLWGHEPTQNGR